MIFVESQGKFYAATKKGIEEKSREGRVWTTLDRQNFPDQKINFLASSVSTLYAATDKGVFGWDAETGLFRDLSMGLGSREARSLYYSPSQDALFAATRRGIFKLVNPDLYFLPNTYKELAPAERQEILQRFENEPSVREIQQAAIEYAEVDPRKIQEWRAAAARKALLPTVSLHRDLSNSNNVDIDRGGTADPDKFITGPNDTSASWYATLSWDMGGLIWNNDQTSIDSRSKLMVELRNDILTEVTHLYFERRRLEIEMAQVVSKDVPMDRVNQEIQLQELTASIDALTGGYLSRRLALQNLAGK